MTVTPIRKADPTAHGPANTRFAKWKPFRGSAVSPGIAPHTEAAQPEVGAREHGVRPGAERGGGTPP